MKVFMCGWEFPPNNRGGLGVACQGIVNGLMNHGVEVNLLLPSSVQVGGAQEGERVRVLKSSRKSGRAQVTLFKIPAGFLPYQSAHEYKMARLAEMPNGSGDALAQKDYLYGESLFEEVQRYAHEASQLADEVEHDVIHAHDWMTYPAGIEVKKRSGKSLVTHVHALEYDRSGDNMNPLIYEIEKMGFEAADKIIAVSGLTKNNIVKYYGIPAEKIVVVHNAVAKKFRKMQSKEFRSGRKNVLFLGRITMQKGPEYFLRAAAKALTVDPDINFLMAGDGDMMGRMIHYAHELGIERHILFSGFLTGKDVEKAFESADLFVMPSVSEPFGIAALEAIGNGVPVLVSKQAGVTEIIPNMLRVDFWDTDEMANKMVMALKHPVLSEELKKLSSRDLENVSWHSQAGKIQHIYHALSASQPV